MFIKVLVTPDAKRESIETRQGQDGEILVISVREPAAQNRANMRVRELVAARFGQLVGKVRILTGHRSCVKMISVNS